LFSDVLYVCVTLVLILDCSDSGGLFGCWVLLFVRLFYNKYVFVVECMLLFFVKVVWLLEFPVVVGQGSSFMFGLCGADSNNRNHNNNNLNNSDCIE
jgi:hypothetical protein